MLPISTIAKAYLDVLTGTELFKMVREVPVQRFTVPDIMAVVPDLKTPAALLVWRGYGQTLDGNQNERLNEWSVVFVFEDPKGEAFLQGREAVDALLQPGEHLVAVTLCDGEVYSRAAHDLEPQVDANDRFAIFTAGLTAEENE